MSLEVKTFITAVSLWSGRRFCIQGRRARPPGIRTDRGPEFLIGITNPGAPWFVLRISNPLGGGREGGRATAGRVCR